MRARWRRLRHGRWAETGEERLGLGVLVHEEVRLGEPEGIVWVGCATDRGAQISSVAARSSCEGARRGCGCLPVIWNTFAPQNCAVPYKCWVIASFLQHRILSTMPSSASASSASGSCCLSYESPSSNIRLLSSPSAAGRRPPLAPGLAVPVVVAEARVERGLFGESESVERLDWRRSPASWSFVSDGCAPCLSPGTRGGGVGWGEAVLGKRSIVVGGVVCELPVSGC